MPDVLDYNSLLSNINNGRVGNLYLFFGPEKLLIHKAVSRMEERLINPALKSLNFIKIEGADVNYDVLVNACETLPFMEDKKIVLVSDCQLFKSSKSQKVDSQDGEMEKQLNYLSNMPPTTVLVLIVDKDVDKRTKAFNIIKKYGQVVEFSSLKGQELARWISDMFQDAGKSISRADVSYLTEQITGHLHDIKNEIGKICSYTGERTMVSRIDIDSVISKSLEINIFQLVDSVSIKNCSNALMILNELLLDGEPIQIILSMVIRQYRLLFNTKLLSKSGYSSSEIADKLLLRSFAVSNLIRVCSGFTEEQLEDKLRKCLQCDRAIKTGRVDNRLAVEALIIEFSK